MIGGMFLSSFLLSLHTDAGSFPEDYILRSLEFTLAALGLWFLACLFYVSGCSANISYHHVSSSVQTLLLCDTSENETCVDFVSYLHKWTELLVPFQYRKKITVATEIT